jgi:hypothetical protein
MSEIRAVVHLDLLTVHSYLNQLLVLLAVGVVVTATMQNPALALLVVAVFASVAGSYPFAIGDKVDLATLHGTLPVRRDAVVLGRYVFAIITFVVVMALAMVVVVVVTAARSLPFEPGFVAFVLVVGLVVFAVAVGIQFPLYFTMGYTRARLLSYLPFAGIFAFVTLIVPRLTLGGIAAIAPAALAAALTVVALVMLVGSAVVSCRLYRRRAL